MYYGGAVVVALLLVLIVGLLYQRHRINHEKEIAGLLWRIDTKEIRFGSPGLVTSASKVSL